MTSFKISEIDGVMVEKIPVYINSWDYLYNAGIDAQSSVRVRFNREKLVWRILDNQPKPLSVEQCQELADAIISAGAGLLEVEK